MMICIAGVLSADELQQVNQLAAKQEFVDGKLTAGWHARKVKNNQQLRGGSDAHTKLTAIVKQALQRNELFQMAARPKTIRSPLFSRYDEGMSYGAHVDNAVMATQSQPMRTDLSFTLFLTPPECYDGGELIVESTQGEQHFKLEAGSMVLYPSSTLHRVETVTSGSRFVAVSWVQSTVRSPEHREILFDLDTARRSLFKQQGKTAEFDLLTKSLSNLMRMWVEV
ncbi:MAG: Fe2+-dependent dioxygenase [Synechococcus sp.]